jgi:hypothetical protein
MVSTVALIAGKKSVFAQIMFPKSKMCDCECKRHYVQADFTSVDFSSVIFPKLASSIVPSVGLVHRQNQTSLGIDSEHLDGSQ